MIATEIVLAAIGGIVAVAAAVYDARRKAIPCNSCKFLIERGGVWKYVCKRDYGWPDSFDTPPKYCKYYKPMEDDNDSERSS